MKLLNTPEMPKGRWLDLPGPDVREIDALGRRVLLDVNTLALAELAPGEAPPDFGAPLKPQFALHAGRDVRRLVLNVTHACNLACGYCFAAGYETQPAMSVKTAQLALERLFEPRRDIMVSFFGGEPLLAWETVQAAMDHAEALARARRVRAGFHITTNGVLLTPEKVEAIAQRTCSLLVSLDGPADIHNAARPAKDRSVDSHAAVLAALDRLHARGVSRRVTARATYPMDSPRLCERVRFLAALQDEGKIAGFSIEPAVMAEGCGGRAGGEIDHERIEAEYRSAAELVLDRLRAGRATHFFHFRKILSRLMHRRIAGSECGAGCGYLTVGPGGGVFACHRESGTRIGHLAGGIDEELRAPWCDNRLYRCAPCRDCWARHVCGGGCRQILAEKGRPLSEVYAPRCAVMKTIIRSCLWLMSDAGPVLLRKMT